MKYRKKPVEIEAVQAIELWNAPYKQWVGWLHDAYKRGEIFVLPDRAEIKTLEGTMSASPSDWIIRGVKGEIYPCKPDIFAATYDVVS